jgi:hypothetical protein
MILFNVPEGKTRSAPHYYVFRRDYSEDLFKLATTWRRSSLTLAESKAALEVIFRIGLSRGRGDEEIDGFREFFFSFCR